MGQQKSVSSVPSATLTARHCSHVATVDPAVDWWAPRKCFESRCGCLQSKVTITITTPDIVASFHFMWTKKWCSNMDATLNKTYVNMCPITKKRSQCQSCYQSHSILKEANTSVSFRFSAAMGWTSTIKLSWIGSLSSEINKTSIETHTHMTDSNGSYLPYSTWHEWLIPLDILGAHVFFLPYYMDGIGAGFLSWVAIFQDDLWNDSTCNTHFSYWKCSARRTQNTWIFLLCVKFLPKKYPKKKKKTTKRQQFFTYLEFPGIVHFD